MRIIHMRFLKTDNENARKMFETRAIHTMLKPSGEPRDSKLVKRDSNVIFYYINA